jgi:hypothetical protein
LDGGEVFVADSFCVVIEVFEIGFVPFIESNVRVSEILVGICVFVFIKEA